MTQNLEMIGLGFTSSDQLQICSEWKALIGQLYNRDEKRVTSDGGSPPTLK
jgi:hypothetical protein